MTGTEDYFTIISKYHRARIPVGRQLLALPTKKALEDLADRLPYNSRLEREVKVFLAVNFPQPRISTR